MIKDVNFLSFLSLIKIITLTNNNFYIIIIIILFIFMEYR